MTQPTETISLSLNRESVISEIESMTTKRHSMWDDSPYQNFPKLSNQTKEKYHKRIVSEYYENFGHEVMEINDHGDLYNITLSHKEELKVATVTGVARHKIWYNQIREDQKYDFLNLMAVFPNRIMVWRIPKSDIDHTILESGTSANGDDRKQIVIYVNRDKNTDTITSVDDFWWAQKNSEDYLIINQKVS